MTQIITTVKEMHEFSLRNRRGGKTIGLVPTMGYLHEGHLSLVDISKKNTDVTVVSVFVNPTQFGPNEDFEKYPRDSERDFALLEKAGVDAIFYPDAKEVYGKNFQTYVDVTEITKKLEGKTRPTHFRGVTTVVSILFNAVKPDFAVFGQKDAQQAAVIKKMNDDLKFGINIHIAPIVRESDGLAMSSRNIYLSPKEREDALVLSRSLEWAEQAIRKGEHETAKISMGMQEILNSVDTSEVDYARVVEAETFREPEIIEHGREYYILVACKIGKTRLIDNRRVRL